MDSLSQKIYDQTLRCGFDKCGIISISALDGFKQLYQQRLNDVPVSQYFYKGVGNLTETKSRFPWAKSIVILVFDYGKYRFPESLQGKYGKAFFLEPEKKVGNASIWNAWKSGFMKMVSKRKAESSLAHSALALSGIWQ